MPNVLLQGNNLQELLKWEAEEYHSREVVTMLAGQSIQWGEVLGMIKAGSVPTTGTAGTNTGGGTCTVVTGGTKTKPGVYTLRCILLVASGGVFSVRDPDGLSLPDAAMGAYTNDQINFTLTDGAPDFALGDSFTITVPAGSLKCKPINFAGIDGSADAYGFALYETDTTDTTKRYIAYTGGGVMPIKVGEVLTGATSGATAQVVSFTLTGGTWAGGDAAGVLVLDSQVGTFQSENLDSVDQANICSIGANTAAYYEDRDATIIVRDAHIVPAYLTWPVGASDAQKAAALAQFYAKGIVTRILS
jgi:hypothetical protein